MRIYKLEFAKQADKYFEKLDRLNKKRINKAFDKLKENPRSPLLDIVPLAGRQGEFRLRVGDYRIIFNVEEEVLLIYVIFIAPRGDVYKK